MAVTITTNELASTTPSSVQIIVNGMTSGDAFYVTGHADGHSWPVQGGQGIADGLQLILTDSRAPWGGPISYQVTIDGQSEESTPITIGDPDVDAVLQSLSGDIVVPVGIATVTDPRTYSSRQATFGVPRRSDVVRRHDVLSSASGPLKVETLTREDTAAMRELLATGAPIVRRQRVGLRDLEPVQIISVTDPSEELVGAVGVLRMWSLPYTVLGDPEPGTPLALFSWDDFDAVYAGSSWDDFDAEWAGSSWDEFDAEDWGARL